MYSKEREIKFWYIDIDNRRGFMLPSQDRKQTIIKKTDFSSSSLNNLRNNIKLKTTDLSDSTMELL
jgi:hypothetical protein